MPLLEAAKQALPELKAGSYTEALPQAQQLAAALNPTADTGAPMPTTPPENCAPGSTLHGSAVGQVLAFAQAQVGKPYVLGANGPDAWDCSSLVQAAFRTIGVQLPRVADVQYEWMRDHGTVVPGPIAPDQLQPGDLLFSVGDDPDTTDDGQRIGHVAIYAGGGLVIEAKGARWGVIESAYTPAHWSYVTWVGRLPVATSSATAAPPSTPSPSSSPAQ